MSKFEELSGRALEIAGNVGDSIRDRVPDKAIKWVETGAALGALKTGGRVASKFVRRNPAVAIATAASAGVMWYLVRRQQKKSQAAGAIEGNSKRIHAKTGNTSARAKATAPRKRATRSSTDS